MRILKVASISIGPGPQHTDVNMTAVGFEPTHPNIVELESTALDRSAKLSIQSNLVGMRQCAHLALADGFACTERYDGSNPRPCGFAHLGGSLNSLAKR